MSYKIHWGVLVIGIIVVIFIARALPGTSVVPFMNKKA